MFIRNVKSFSDLDAKKALSKNILDIEVENEVENAKRTEFRRNPGYKAPEGEKIQPQYKTSAELQKDRAVQEKEARSNLEALGFDYQKASDMIVWLSSSLINRLVEFNSFYKGIEKELKATTNPKLLSVEYLKNYLERYFDDLDVNYGRKFGVAEPQLATTFEELELLFPDVDALQNVLLQFQDILRDEIFNDVHAGDPVMVNAIADILSNTMLAIELIAVFKAVKPSDAIISNMKIALTQNERQKLLKSYSSLLRRHNLLTTDERDRILVLANKILADAAGGGMDIDETNLIIKRIIKAFTDVTKEGVISTFNKIGEQFYNQIGDTDKAAGVKKLLEEQLAQQRIVFPAVNVARNNEIAKQLASEALKTHINTGFVATTPSQLQLEQIQRITPALLTPDQRAIRDAELLKAEIINERADRHTEDFFTELGAVAARNPVNIFTTNAKGDRDYRKMGDQEEILRNIAVNQMGIPQAQVDAMSNNQLKNYIRERQRDRVIINPAYDPVTAPDFVPNFYFKPDKAVMSAAAFKKLPPADQAAAIRTIPLRLGLGTKKKKTKVDKEYEKAVKGIPKKSIADMAKYLKQHFKHDEKYEEIISSQLKQLNKKMKDDSSSDEEIVKKDTIGLGFNAKRIDVKKKVGKGVTIDKEENPTYRTFGKYVIHVPHLVNNSVANFKYPSLGSIPSIKPLTISTDYKDFLIDVVNNGKINEAAYKHLPNDEIKHFEKVVVGAGLVEKFKLKLGSSEDDKKDLKRFELLRGEYVAGNNAPTMIKELRMLIVKFMNNGRIHKQEGLNLLMELATI
jgi:hypothetical protein